MYIHGCTGLSRKRESSNINQATLRNRDPKNKSHLNCNSGRIALTEVFGGDRIPFCKANNIPFKVTKRPEVYWVIPEIILLGFQTSTHTAFIKLSCKILKGVLYLYV